ncbi:MAG TPA: amidohydrolase [Clostridiaceae bacterium]|nr:amidohydrolase [Clostridiaceae bacterium]
MSTFEIKEVDRIFYEKELKDFLPGKIIDIHTHVHTLKYRVPVEIKRTVVWPSLVAPENTGEQIQEMYKLMFPDKEVTPLMFASIRRGQDFKKNNDYVAEVSREYGFPALYFSRPEETPEELEANLKEGNFLGLKSYLTLAPEYIPEKEIRIFDFFPKYQFEAANKNGWIIMLHIPRNQRLKDKVNLAQLLEIDEKYPNAKVIVAHIGRAYADSDVGDAFEVLSVTKNLYFDFSANTNKNIIQQAIETFGPKRVLFGSDAPICKMRMKRIVENGTYINLVPKGLYGDESQDPHLRGVEGPEADTFTFFMYEILHAFKRAAIDLGLSRSDIEDIMYNNAKKIIEA